MSASSGFPFHFDVVDESTAGLRAVKLDRIIGVSESLEDENPQGMKSFEMRWRRWFEKHLDNVYESSQSTMSPYSRLLVGDTVRGGTKRACDEDDFKYHSLLDRLDDGTTNDRPPDVA